MYKILSLSVLIVFTSVLFINCKSTKVLQEQLPPYDIITTEFIDHQIYNSQLNSYQDSLVVVVDIITDKNFVNNANKLLKLSIEEKKSLKEFKNDSVYEFNGIDLYIFSNNQKIRNLFNQKFQFQSKEVDKAVNFTKADYTRRWESLSVIDFYLNEENEITYISPGEDKIYYNLLKNKVAFDNNFWPQ